MPNSLRSSSVSAPPLALAAAMILALSTGPRVLPWAAASSWALAQASSGVIWAAASFSWSSKV